MKFKMLLLLVISFASFASFAQEVVAPTATFSASAKAIALPGGKETIPGSIVGAEFAITDHFSLVQANVLSGDMNAYMGGGKYVLPALSKKLHNASPVLDGSTFQFYVKGLAGIDSVANRQHWAFMGLFGINYDPTHSGKFSVNLIEAGYGKFPGFVNSAPIVSTGVSIGFGGAK